MKFQALISTIEPIDGGVPAMTRWVCIMLEELGITPTLAWYAPWKNYPSLSVPSYNIFRGRRPQSLHKVSFERYESYGIGAWLPELEFTHYRPSVHWEKLIDNCDLHLAVSGNVLCALPYLKAQIPFLAWIATPWEADRKDRIRKFSFPRLILDKIINTPIIKNLEEDILNYSDGDILCLSSYTKRELDLISPANQRSVMYMPIDTAIYHPNYKQTKPWRIGFSGRYCDPRKNIELLLESIRILLACGHPVELILVGEKNLTTIKSLIRSFGLEGNVFCYTHFSPTRLASLLQTFDVFAIPSHQEGLCIAALEAMACGVPVISTRCGGPEDFVQPGITGELVDKNPNAFALRLKHLCLDREKRHQMSAAAISWIEENASRNASRQNFQTHLRSFIKKKGIKCFQLSTH